MLYLHTLLLTFYISCVEPVTIQPMANSMTKKIGDGQSTARITCQVSSASYVHWYVQKKNEGLKKILYISNNGIPESGIDTTKYKPEKRSDDYILNIYRLTDEDKGTYYCASWYSTHWYKPAQTLTTLNYLMFVFQACSCCFCVCCKSQCIYKIFGTGTELILTDKTLKQPEVTTFITPGEHVERTEVAVYLCSLQNFFPGVIKVAWNKDGSDEELESEQGEIIHNIASDTYSLSTWITVVKSNLDNTFICKYKHETTSGRWEKKILKIEYATEYYTQNKTCIDNYEISAGDVHVYPTTFRAVQLIYSMLLLKSFMYCPLLIFVKNKLK
ncbi:immunoglobulin kappa light chain-like [Mixophyes fleayi]|uniref:immunoglobulin kappa light chain-like n=1 Tax=Mixophyes fleayi TaxID=3061075 RepID=UPI003F4DAD1B